MRFFIKELGKYALDMLMVVTIVIYQNILNRPIRRCHLDGFIL